MRKHIFNEDFFEEINTEEKAYWLGFICADGYINKRGNTVGITLDRSDENHLHKFLKCLNSNLMRLDYRESRYDENSPLTKKVTVNLYSSKMNKDLVNLGLSIRKSKDLKEIKLDEDLRHHFIRGYFDGDGCVFESYTKGKNKPCYSPGFTFVGTKEFLDFINDSLPFKVKKLIYDKRTESSYTLYVRSQKRFISLEDYMYEKATIFLDRKKQKCELIKERIKEGSETRASARTLK